jgi:hypothetical protein
MSFRLTRLPRTVQPQEYAAPNPDWLARRMSYLWGMPNGSSILRIQNLVDGRYADAQDSNNDLAPVTTRFGIAGRNRGLTAPNACNYLTTTTALTGAQELTLLAWFVFGSSDDNVQWLNFRTDNQHTLDVFSKTTTSITWGADWAGAWNGASQQTLSGLVDGDFVCIGASINQAGARFFANGRFSGTKSGSGFTTSSSSVSVTRQTRASQLGGAVLRSALSDAEMQAITANPWQLFDDEIILVPVEASSSEPTGTLDSTLAALTLSSEATVAAGPAATLTATLAALTLSSEATAAAGPTATLSATLGALTLASEATASSGASATVAATLAPVTLASAAEAAAGPSATLSATLGPVTLASEATTITGTLASLAGTLGALTLAANAETAAGPAATLAGTLGALTLAASAEVTEFVPSGDTEATVAVTLGALTLVSNAAVASPDPTLPRTRRIGPASLAAVPQRAVTLRSRRRIGRETLERRAA